MRPIAERVFFAYNKGRSGWFPIWLGKGYMEKEYSKMQLEDKALKSAAMYFGQELLRYLRIDNQIVRMLPTEQIRLEAVRAEEDILFEMQDGTLTHFEFESVEVTEDDLRRFRYYDACTELHYRKGVVTYVICSGKMSRIRRVLKCGVNTYRIIPLQMKQMDADEIFARLAEKRQKGEVLQKEELVPLLLTPLMTGESSIKERILDANELITCDESILQKEDRQRMEAVLYAFACKFLEKTDLREVKETIGMTELGEMIWNDGLEAGMKQGKLVTIISQVTRKLKKNLTPEQIAEELEEDLEQVKQICAIAAQCAPDYDCEKIYRLWKENPLPT